MYPYDSYGNTGYGATVNPLNQYLNPQAGTAAPMLQQTRQPVQNQQNQVIFYYVQNSEAANNWLLGKNEKVYLMDSSQPVMYLKATDQDGRYYPMKTFDLVEREIPVQGPNQAPPIDTSSFVKRDEIDKMVTDAIKAYFSNTVSRGE